MLVLWIGALVLMICITHWVYHWRNPKCNGKLPPGSMGFPLLGETLQFFSPNTTSDIPPFVKERMKRYGPVFKTSIVGRPVIVSADPDLNHFVFLQEGQLFQSWYPDTFTEIFGRQNVGSLHGFMYKYLKNMVLNLFGPESLKKMLPEVEQTARRRLQCWSNQETVELKESTASMIFDLTAKKLISYDQDNSSENLRENFVAFIQGLISFPLDIPGTAYHKCLQGRKNAMKMLKSLLNERRAMPGKSRNDFFDFVLEELQKEGTILTEAIALDLMFVLLFASFETTSLALTLAVKFLSDDPSVHSSWLGNNGLSPSCAPESSKIPTSPDLQSIKMGGGLILEIPSTFPSGIAPFRWEPIKGGNILRTPGLQFPDGFHIRLMEKTRME